MTERERKFEEMLNDILTQYAEVSEKMELLKAEGKNKTVAFKQLLASKLTLQNILIMYKNHGLIDSF